MLGVFKRTVSMNQALQKWKWANMYTCVVREYHALKAYIYISFKVVQSTVVPRPLSNDPRFTQCIYRYSRASKRFVEV